MITLREINHFLDIWEQEIRRNSRNVQGAFQTFKSQLRVSAARELNVTVEQLQFVEPEIPAGPQTIRYFNRIKGYMSMIIGESAADEAARQV